VKAGTIRILALAALLAQPALAALPQQTKELQAQFDQENDVVRRAKLMIRLSNEDFHQIREFLKAQDNASALKLLQQFRDDAQDCDTQLEARQGNAETHPAGFKDLQVAMRESLRRLDDLMNGLISDEQPPFQAVREDLEEIDRRLIRQLFPHQPLPNEPAAKP
jgi:hypothetical protein